MLIKIERINNQVKLVLSFLNQSVSGKTQLQNTIIQKGIQKYPNGLNFSQSFTATITKPVVCARL